jgi:hypothetical protein
MTPIDETVTPDPAPASKGRRRDTMARSERNLGEWVVWGLVTFAVLQLYRVPGTYEDNLCGAWG